jgi:hypothetical protein
MPATREASRSQIKSIRDGAEDERDSGEQWTAAQEAVARRGGGNEDRKEFRRGAAKAEAHSKGICQTRPSCKAAGSVRHRQRARQLKEGTGHECIQSRGGLKARDEMWTHKGTSTRESRLIRRVFGGRAASSGGTMHEAKNLHRKAGEPGHRRSRLFVLRSCVSNCARARRLQPFAVRCNPFVPLNRHDRKRKSELSERRARSIKSVDVRQQSLGAQVD